MQKRAIKFYQHLKASEPSSYHYKALQCQEESKEGSPLSQLVHRLSSNSTGHQDRPHTIQPNQIIAKEKDNYINYWTSTTKTQSKLQCYLALNRQYSMADYLSSVTDLRLRKTLTMYKLSDHSLALESGRHRQTCLLRDEWLCQFCPHRQMETEHFLQHCDTYTDIRTQIYAKITRTTPDFPRLLDQEKLHHLLGEKTGTAVCSKICEYLLRRRDKLHNNT